MKQSPSHSKLHKNTQHSKPFHLHLFANLYDVITVTLALSHPLPFIIQPVFPLLLPTAHILFTFFTFSIIKYRNTLGRDIPKFICTVLKKQGAVFYREHGRVRSPGGTQHPHLCEQGVTVWVLHQADADSLISITRWLLCMSKMEVI